MSEFSSRRLRRLLSDVKASSGTLRRPSVDQVNLRDPSSCAQSIPRQLETLARDEAIELLTHADCSDLLPPATFSALLDGVADRLPTALRQTRDGRFVSRPFAAEWVLKYTIVHRERMSVVDKGYIVKSAC